MRSAALAVWMLIPAVCANSEPSSAEFSKLAWQSIQSTYREIVHHPFNVELRNGSLDSDKFRFYENQDAFYLARLSQVLRVLARKVSNPDHKNVINRLADDCSKETTLENTPELTRVSPAALAYSSFLLSLSPRNRARAPAALYAYRVLFGSSQAGTNAQHTSKAK